MRYKKSRVGAKTLGGGRGLESLEVALGHDFPERIATLNWARHVRRYLDVDQFSE
jgi:hypothetical protein